MKTARITLVAVFFCGIAFSQEYFNPPRTVDLKMVTVRPLNITYARSVVDNRMPETVTQLENKAARYNIFENPVYDETFEAYEVTFSHEKGSIVATYDQNGKIVQTAERFKNITLPPFIRTKIHAEHPGWIIHTDLYQVVYNGSKKVKKICRVQLRKDGQKKNIRIEI